MKNSSGKIVLKKITRYLGPRDLVKCFTQVSLIFSDTDLSRFNIEYVINLTNIST